MTKSTNVLPGMCSDNVELFVQNDSLKAIQSGKVMSFAELPFATISVLEETIKADKEVQLALHDMHPTSKIKRTEQFAICRLGGLDFEADIQDGHLQNGEYWPCPKHGSCPHEGILCKLPTVNGHELSKIEVKVLQLTSTDKTNEVIAEELNLPMGTFHKIKKELYSFLGIQTKQEGSIISKIHNLI